MVARSPVCFDQLLKPSSLVGGYVGGLEGVFVVIQSGALSVALSPVFLFRSHELKPLIGVNVGYVVGYEGVFVGNRTLELVGGPLPICFDQLLEPNSLCLTVECWRVALLASKPELCWWLCHQFASTSRLSHHRCPLVCGFVGGW